MLRILILSDGRPGHVNLSYGIAAAMERLRPATVQEVPVRRGRWPGAVLAAATRLPLPPTLMLRLVFGLDAAAFDAATFDTGGLPDAGEASNCGATGAHVSGGCDVIVSAGAETLAANVWLARVLRAPNVFYGSLRWFRPQDFSLVLTSYAAKASRPRHALALKPSRFDPDSGAFAAGATSLGDATLRVGSDVTPSGRRLAALILGGNSGTFDYDAADWQRLVALVAETAAAHGTVWLVSNSRRTPAHVSDRIAALAATPGSGIATFIDVRQPDAEPLAGLLASASLVVCTDDSSSMVSEAVWARRPVIGIRPARSGFDRNEQGYRDWLQGQGFYRSLPLAELTADTLIRAAHALTPLDRNPQAALAALLGERLPDLLPATPTDQALTKTPPQS